MGRGWSLLSQTTPLKRVISEMLGLVRKILGCVVRIWLCFLHTFCRKKQQAKSIFVKSGDGADNWEAEGWDDFTVQVVPNDSGEAAHEGAGGAESESAEGQQEQQDEDFFEDMKPVFRKPKKVRRMVMGLSLQL